MTLIIDSGNATLILERGIKGADGTLPALVMADITDKQGKVLDDPKPMLYTDIDTTTVPNRYVTTDGGFTTGALVDVWLDGSGSGAIFQKVESPVFGLVQERYYYEGAWSPWVTTITDSKLAKWYSDTTASAADAVINADGSFSRSLFVPASLAPKITVGLTAEADTDILRPAPLTTATTFPNPTGTPMDGFGFVIELIDDGTARALTWGSDYAAGFAALPTTTTAGKLGQIAVQYRSGKYRCDGVRWMA